MSAAPTRVLDGCRACGLPTRFARPLEERWGELAMRAGWGLDRISALAWFRSA